MYNEVLILIGPASVQLNAIGDPAGDDAGKEVFARVRSVGGKRKLEGLAAGLKLEWKFDLADYYDYDGEEKVRYNGVEYNVVNAYRTADGGVELTVSRY